MPITDSRVKTGSLVFDPTGTPVDVSCQPTAVSIQPQNTTGTEDIVEVLCGDTIDDSSQGALEANLVLTSIQDFTNSSGLIAYSWQENGNPVEFEWSPTSDPGDTWSGTCVMQAMEVGGEVSTRLSSQASLRITALTMPTNLGGAAVIP